MSWIHAAVVESFGEPPRYATVPAPVAGEGQELVDVLAVGVHPATRGVAAGKHYTNTSNPPIVAGIDAVVRRADGRLAMVMAPETGTLAEQIAVDPASLIPVPAGADPSVVAATMNPALSSWVALQARVGFQPGQSLLVIGATGNAGSAAVKIGKAVGAARVIAAGRNRARLEQLLAEGADEIIAITPDEDQTSAAFAEAAEVDAVSTTSGDRKPNARWQRSIRRAPITSRSLTGSRSAAWAARKSRSAGTSCGTTRCGSAAAGSAPCRWSAPTCPELATMIARGEITVTPRTIPLSDVTAAWSRDDAKGERTVIVL